MQVFFQKFYLLWEKRYLYFPFYGITIQFIWNSIHYSFLQPNQNRAKYYPVLQTVFHLVFTLQSQKPSQMTAIDKNVKNLEYERNIKTKHKKITHLFHEKICVQLLKSGKNHGIFRIVQHHFKFRIALSTSKFIFKP